MKKINSTISKDLQHASSSNNSEYNSDESSYSAIVKKNLFKKPKMQMSFWTLTMITKMRITS